MFRDKEIVSDEGSWYTQLGRLKRAFSELTDADLNYNQSQKDEMVSALCILLGVKSDIILNIMLRKPNA